MEGSNQPSLQEYARFYHLSEDYMLDFPTKYIDQFCEPRPPIPPRDGLPAANPEERMREVEHAFRSSILKDRLAGNPKDMEPLQRALCPEPYNGNIWRPLLPDLRTSDLAPVPVLSTLNESGSTSLMTGLLPDEPVSEIPVPPPEIELADTNSSSANTYSESMSIPANYLGLIPGPDVEAEMQSLGIDVILRNEELSAQSPVLSGINPLNHITIPSGPGVPAVAPDSRAVFEHYNSSPHPDIPGLRSGYSNTVVAAEKCMREVDLVTGTRAAQLHSSYESSCQQPIVQMGIPIADNACPEGLVSSMEDFQVLTLY